MGMEIVVVRPRDCLATYLLIELGDLVLSAVLDRHVEVLESCLEGVLQKTGLL